MNRWREIRAATAAVMATGLLGTRAHALVTLNDSHDHIYVVGSFGVTRDSNVFASRDSDGDFVYSSGVTAEYSRRAGWIGVNATVAVNAGKFGKLRSEDFSNPSYSLELTKQSGRTTGSFTLSGARESRADAAVNIRSTSWNYNAGLNFKYPIVQRYTLAGGFSYASRRYVEETALANLSTYSANLDLFYMLSNQRDLTASYRWREVSLSRHTSSTDHALSAGVSGRVIRGLNGSVRVGYQVRTPHGTKGDSSEYHAINASAAVTYALNRKINISGHVGKDFSTTATDTNVDSTSAGLDSGYVYNSHWSITGGVGWGDSRFLGEKGRIVLQPGPPAVLGVNRHDNFANWNAALNYSLNEHFKASLTYAWFENWSTVAFADFVRTTWALTLTSRW